MPNHCFQAINENPTPGTSEFKVKFNRDVQGQYNYQESDVSTQTQTEELMCDIQRTAETNMMSGTGYTENINSTADESDERPPGPPSSLTTASGVALSGAMIFNALAAGNDDAIENEWVTLDQCLTHPTPTKNYHYHMWSPCYKKGNGYASTKKAPDMCKDEPSCYEAPINFAINAAYTDTSTYGSIIGVTKDGFMIYGPYNQ